MRKETPKREPKPTDALLKASRKNDSELTEKELGQVSGGVSENLSLNFTKVKFEYQE